MTFVRPTTYSVSALPPKHEWAPLRTLYVVADEKDPGSWYVTRYGFRYLPDGSTVFQPPMGTQDEKDRARKASLMDFDAAMETAKRLAPTLMDGGGPARSTV